MSETPNLHLPYLLAAQAQKHVTHNEALRALDAIVQLSVLDRDLTTTPGAPVDGSRFIVAPGATGNWAGKDGQIAAFQDNAWMYYPPSAGWLAWVADENKLLAWDGAAWNEVSGGGSGGGGGTSPNLLINGDFQINQRGFSGGALAAGIYGFDRWKADASGANLSITGFTVTLTSGTILQGVEPSIFGYANLASAQVTLSVEDLSGGDLTVTVGTAAPVTLTAGTGRRSVLVTSDAADTGNIDVRLAPTSGAVSFKRCKIEIGSTATNWQARGLVTELNLCQRYFQKTYGLSVAPGTVTQNNQLLMRDVSSSAFKDGFTQLLSVGMRAAPSVTWYSPQSGASGKVYGYGSVSADKTVTATVGNGEKSTGYPNLGASFGGSNNLWTAHYTLDAEI